MKNNYSLRIRMGAGNWDATLLATGQRFNFREMNYEQKKRWYGAFMSSVRKLFRGNRRGGAK